MIDRLTWQKPEMREHARDTIFSRVIIQNTNIEVRILKAFQKISVAHALRLCREKLVGIALLSGHRILHALVEKRGRALEMLAHHHDKFDSQLFSDLSFESAAKIHKILAAGEDFGADDNIFF